MFASPADSDGGGGGGGNPLLAAISGFGKNKLKSTAAASPAAASTSTPTASAAPAAPSTPAATTAAMSLDDRDNARLSAALQVGAPAAASPSTAASAANSGSGVAQTSVPFPPPVANFNTTAINLMGGQPVGTPVLVMGPAGPIHMLMTLEGTLLPLPAAWQPQPQAAALLSPAMSGSAQRQLSSPPSGEAPPAGTALAYSSFAAASPPSPGRHAARAELNFNHASRGSRTVLASPGGGPATPAAPSARQDDGPAPSSHSKRPAEGGDEAGGGSSADEGEAGSASGSGGGHGPSFDDLLEALPGLGERGGARVASSSAASAAGSPSFGVAGVTTAPLRRRTDAAPHAGPSETVPVAVGGASPGRAAAAAAAAALTSPAGRGKPAPTAGLGSFMFVRNSRHDDAKPPSPDNPRFWVGRVAEIMRGGRVRLHWHRETEPGSGTYEATNNYFPERGALLRPFKSAVYDAARRAWLVYPVVERMPEAAAVAAGDRERALLAARAATATADAEDDGVDGAAKGSSAGPGAVSDMAPLPVGSFVFMRNARFKADAESPAMPRYWVARVTANPRAVAQAAAPATTSKGGAAAAAAALAASLLVPSTVDAEGKLRLQWLRESANGSGLYTPTSSVFNESQHLVRPLPGGMTFDPTMQVWRRGSTGAAGSAPLPLCFPGDESLLAAKVLPGAALRSGEGPMSEADVTAAVRALTVGSPAPQPHKPAGAASASGSAANGGAAAGASAAAPAAAAAAAAQPPQNPAAGVALRIPAVPVTISSASLAAAPTFAFIVNTKWKPGSAEATTFPRFWVARALDVVSGKGGVRRVKVQWHQETAVGSRLFRATAKTFFEAPEGLRPLPDMVAVEEEAEPLAPAPPQLGAAPTAATAAAKPPTTTWRLTGPYNEGGAFVLEPLPQPVAAAAASPAPTAAAAPAATAAAAAAPTNAASPAAAAGSPSAPRPSMPAAATGGPPRPAGPAAPAAGGPPRPAGPTAPAAGGPPRPPGPAGPAAPAAGGPPRPPGPAGPAAPAAGGPPRPPGPSGPAAAGPPRPPMPFAPAAAADDDSSSGGGGGGGNPLLAAISGFGKNKLKSASAPAPAPAATSAPAAASVTPPGSPPKPAAAAPADPPPVVVSEPRAPQPATTVTQAAAPSAPSRPPGT